MSYKRRAATEAIARVAPATTLFEDPKRDPAAPLLPGGLVGVGVALVVFEGLVEVVAGTAVVVPGEVATEELPVAVGAVVAGGGGTAPPPAQIASFIETNISA